MCGIFGLWNMDQAPVDTMRVQRATNLLRHRGPDDEGYLLVNTGNDRVIGCGGSETDARLALPRLEEFRTQPFDLVFGFRRLAILDLSPAGHQPMSSSEERLWIVFNGEIYNYRELRAELSGLGYSFGTGTDTEVILAAYDRWGEDCLSRLNGMWAFAIWDRAARRLMLARDRSGIKPLYYARPGGGACLAFASEIKALVGPGLAAAEIDEKAIYRFLAAGILPSPQKGETFFGTVASLPPGHFLTARAGELRLSRYWSLWTRSDDGPPASAAEAAKLYRELFTDSVRLQWHADVPVGTCLSGGLDSSAIVCTVHQLLKEQGLRAEQRSARQKSFSAVYRTEGKFNERLHIDKILAETGAEGNFTYPTVERLREEMPKLLWHQEEPFQTTSIFAQWCVMDEASRRGVKVLLDGQGADELLGGYRPFSIYLGDLLREVRVGWAMSEALAIRRQTGMSASPLLAAGVAQMMPVAWIDAARQARDRCCLDLSVLQSDFSAQWGNETAAEWRSWEDHSNLDLHLRNLVEESSLPHLLRFEDRNSMAFSIEARVPFLDHRLIELSFREAAAWRIHQGWTKWILRKAMENVVPDDIIWRRDKVGFETPEAEWLRDWVSKDPGLFPEDCASRRYLNRAEVQRHLSTWLESRGSRIPVWRWINLELWLRVWRP